MTTPPSSTTSPPLPHLTLIPGMVPRSGKVRDVFDFGDRLLFVASDRISAFDWVLPTAIPDKGRVLTQLSLFWFDQLSRGPLALRHHVLSDDPTTLALPAGTDVAKLRGRSLVVRKLSIFPVECVVRGYLSGSGWKEYQQRGTVCGIKLPAGLQESAKLPTPIFTPATKAVSGHDENIPFSTMEEIVGREKAVALRDLSLQIYAAGSSLAAERGVILADTKFEFGELDGQIWLADEVLTPDSSRFWPADKYQPGRGQPSFDKQFVRDWLEQTTWDKNSPPPELPNDVVQRTRAKYVEAFERLTGRSFA